MLNATTAAVPPGNPIADVWFDRVPRKSEMKKQIIQALSTAINPTAAFCMVFILNVSGKSGRRKRRSTLKLHKILRKPV